MRALVKNEEKKLVVKVLRSLQFLIFALLIMVVVVWLLLILNMKLNSTVASIFYSVTRIGAFFLSGGIKIGLYYIDFSYLSTVIVFFLILYFIDFVIEYLGNLDKKNKIKKLNEEKRELVEVNAEIQRDLVQAELKNNSFIVLFDFSIKDNRSSWESENARKHTKKDIIISLLALLEGNLDCESVFVDDNIMLIFENSFSSVDITLNMICSLMRTLVEEYKQKKCSITWSAALDVYKDRVDREKKSQEMLRLLPLQIPHFSCLGTFKNRYELKTNPRYTIKSNGVYAISGNEEIFTLETKNI